ncbi:hypothetical protein BDV96DRAFT_635868 [Lophiotrema nucula]|uniref:Uncharacterized protein n=1 Tax=Lophiotrema nucula TaxID=690887 RepID=A0A6A5YUY6_9PLEO|nr:hypothetical protein BDV96DRAFT_635868 [Lophiotrema nucula]
MVSINRDQLALWMSHPDYVEQIDLHSKDFGWTEGQTCTRSMIMIVEVEKSEELVKARGKARSLYRLKFSLRSNDPVVSQIRTVECCKRLQDFLHHDGMGRQNQALCYDSGKLEKRQQLLLDAHSANASVKYEEHETDIQGLDLPPYTRGHFAFLYDATKPPRINQSPLQYEESLDPLKPLTLSRYSVVALRFCLEKYWSPSGRTSKLKMEEIYVLQSAPSSWGRQTRDRVKRQLAGPTNSPTRARVRLQAAFARTKRSAARDDSDELDDSNKRPRREE